MRLQPAVLCAAVATLAAQSSKSRRTADRPVEWPVYGGGPESIRYSSLTQINRANVTHLQVAWTFDASDSTVGTELEVNPIVVHGVLYATTASLNVVALNAATGGLLSATTLRLAVVAYRDRKSTRLNSSHRCISYAVFCLKKK